MMTVEALAVRVRVRVGELHPHSPEARHANTVLADAYAAEYPADDWEPVTPEWLEAVGFRPAAGVRHTLRLGMVYACPPCAGLGWWCGIRVGEVGAFTAVPTPRTRGDVRRLLAALGVT